MMRMGILDKRWPLTPRDSAAPAWADAPDKEWQQRRMEVYAAQVDRMDQNVGRILGALRKKGQLDNTLVMFLADNGGCAEELAPATQPRLRRGRAEARREGRDRQHARACMPGGENTFASYGLPWANASNTPFRLYKHWVHEGGISTPFIARWPKGIARPRHADAPARPPHRHHGHLRRRLRRAAIPSTDPADGRTQPAARVPGRQIERTDALYWEHEGNRAVRDGKWKLVSRHPDRWELYDMEADRSELNDLAAREPGHGGAARRHARNGRRASASGTGQTVQQDAGCIYAITRTARRQQWHTIAFPDGISSTARCSPARSRRRASAALLP